MESRWVCDRCGGWIYEDVQTGGGTCDTCYVRILSDGSIDESDCEFNDFEFE